MPFTIPWKDVLTFLTSTSFTLRKMRTLHMLSYDHQGGKSFFETNKIFTKTYHFRGRLWGKSYRTIVAGTQHMDGTWKHLKKFDRRCPTKKKTKGVQKRYTWATAGHGVTTLPCCRLWLLRCHKRSGTASVEKRKKLEE